MAGGSGYGAPAGPQMGGQPNFYGGFQSRFSMPNQYGFMGYQRSYQPMAWSNPYWRPQPVQPPQMPVAGTGMNGQPVSSPSTMVQQYQQLLQARQERAQADQNQANYDYTANSGAV